MAVMHYTANAVRMNNTLAQNDILAVRNAFLKYDLNEQTKLLVKMPVSEAIAMLRELPLRHIQQLLEMLDERGEKACMTHLAHGLGLKGVETGAVDYMRERFGWIIGMALLAMASVMLFDFSAVNIPWWF